MITSARNYLPYFNERRLAFESGEHVDYSDTGYVLLGAIVEAGSGQNSYGWVGR